MITDLDESPNAVKENIDEAQSFFNNVKVQETKFLLNALRDPLSTKLRQELPESPGEPLDVEIGALV